MAHAVKASWMWVGAAGPRVWSQLRTVSLQSERVGVRSSRKIILNVEAEVCV